MAKLKNLPKKPKKSASAETWKNWERRAQEVKKHNKKIIADQKTKEAIINRARSMRKI